MAIKGDINYDLIASTVSGWWEDWTVARQDKEKIWDEVVQAYLVHVDESKFDKWPWRCKVADPFCQETADTIASQLRNFLFPVNEKYFEVQGLNLIGQAQAARMQGFIETQLKLTQFIESVMPWLKQISVIGNAPFLLRYGTIRESFTRRELQVNLTTRRTSVQEVKTVAGMKEGVIFESLDAYDVAFDPAAIILCDSPVIRRMTLPLPQVEQKAAAWRLEHVDLLAEEGGRAPEEQSDMHKQTRQRLFGLQEEAQGQEKDQDVELLWCWGDLLFDGELYENYVVVVANRTQVLRCEPHGFWAGRPINWGGYDPMWNSAYHKGPLEPVRGTQHLLNTFQCQKADILNLIINGSFLYVDDGIIDPDLLYMKPAGGIPVGNINNVKPLQPTNNVALTYTEIEQLRARGERSSGVSRFDMGQAPGGRRTAYEANLIRGGGSTRMNDVLRHLANGPLEAALNWIVRTNQQFKWDSGEIDNQTLLGDYYVQFTGADISVVRNFELQNQMLLLQLLSQSPELAAAVNKRNLMSKLLGTLSMNDPALINTPEEMERELALLQQAARPQPALGPQPEGVVGGADEQLRSLVANLGTP